MDLLLMTRQMKRFLYVSGLIDKVNAEDKVSFEIIEDKRGKKAQEVKKV